MLKLNPKSFISGLIIGTSLISVPTLAEEAMKIFKNPYPIEINGQKQEVKAYNIDDSTYLSLRDVAAIFKTTVNFNETEQKIEIGKSKKEIGVQQTSDASNFRTYNKHDMEIYNINGIEYASLRQYTEKYHDILFLDYDFNSQTVILYKSSKSMLENESPLIENIKYITFQDRGLIEYEYFINEILPKVKSK